MGTHGAACMHLLFDSLIFLVKWAVGLQRLRSIMPWALQNREEAVVGAVVIIKGIRGEQLLE